MFSALRRWLPKRQYSTVRAGHTEESTPTCVPELYSVRQVCSMLRSVSFAPWLFVLLACDLIPAQEGRLPSRSLITPSNQVVSFAPVASFAYDEPKVLFRTSTRLVQVPVVVTDKSGRHIP